MLVLPSNALLGALLPSVLEAVAGLLSARLTAGRAVTVKLPLLRAVPSGVVTPILPVVALVGTVAVIWVFEPIENALTTTPLKVTCVALKKLLPLIVTCVPAGPLLGVNELILGGTVTVKISLLVTLPPGVVTRMTPVVAPVGTVMRT